MITKKYRALFLITILFSSLLHGATLSDHDRKIINHLAREALLLYAMQQDIAPDDHLKTISSQLFGSTNVALVILTKKIMRHVCKQLHVQGQPKLALYVAALKKFQKYQRPASGKKTTYRKKRDTSSLKDLAVQFLKNHSLKIIASCLVCLVLATLLTTCQELYERVHALEEILSNAVITATKVEDEDA